MKKRKFLRRLTNALLRFGKRKKKKRKWRKPRGRHSKVRKKRKGYVKPVSIGYGKPKEKKGLIKGLKPVVVHNVEELKKVKQDEIVIIASGIGKKKKIEMAKTILENNIKVLNFDAKKFLEDVEKEKVVKEREGKETSKKEESKEVKKEKSDKK